MADDSVFQGAAGIPGPQGPQGIQGLQGNPGQGVPVGGTAGQVLEKIDGTDYNTQWVDAGSVVFGTEFNEFEDLPLSSTSSNNWTLATRFTTPSLPAGDYFVAWSADAGLNGNKQGAHRLQNGTNDLMKIGYKLESGSDENEAWTSFAGHAILALSGVETFDFDYQGQDDAYFRDVRLTLWRVA